MRRRWRAQLVRLADALDEDGAVLGPHDIVRELRASLRKRGGPADVDAIARWVFEAHDAEAVAAGERSLVDDLAEAFLVVFPQETTAALLRGLRADGPPWLVTLLAASTAPGVGAALIAALPLDALGEDDQVVLLDALHARAAAGDDDALAFLRVVDEEPLPRKAKGALRSARFRLRL